MAAPSIVQKKSAYNTSAASSLTVTFDTTPGVGRLIVVFGFASGGLPTIADNQGNTYTQRESEGFDAIWGRLWTAPATTASGSFTITLTSSSGTQSLSLMAFEVANWNTSPVYEKLGHYWTVGPTNVDYSPLNFDSAATTNAEQLFLAALASQLPFSRTISASTGWTDELASPAGTDRINFGAISKTVIATGTYDPEWDMSSAGSVEYLALGISLVGGTEGGGGGGGQAARAAVISMMMNGR